MVLFVDKCLEYCDIKQYQAICKWRGLKPTLTNIQNFHKQFATTRGKYTVEKESPLFAEYTARTEWTPTESQKEKLDTLYSEYLTFSNAHLAKIYGLSENKVEKLFSNAFGVKPDAISNKTKILVDDMSDEDLKKLTKVQRHRALKKGYIYTV